MAYSSGTDIFYGVRQGSSDAVGDGVFLHNWMTNLFEQSPVYDSSGTDTMYDKFVISGECILSPVLTAQVAQSLGIEIGGFSGGLFPITRIADGLQRRLDRQRQNFAMFMNGQSLLMVDACNQPDGTVTELSDVNNGPRVTAKVTHFSPATLHVQATFELCRPVCDSPRIRQVLNNRWQIADDIDETFTTSRVIRGKVRLSNVKFEPQMYRGMVVPPLLKGWKRAKMHFTTDPTGLELGYEIHDREMKGPAPPGPAMKMTATHVQSFSAEALKVMETLNVRLDGGRTSDKKEMAQMCLQIVVNKLRYNATTAKNAKHITSFVLADHFGDDINAIECHVEVWRTDPIASLQSIGPINANKFGDSLSLPGSYDIDKAVNLGPYPAGEAGAAGLLACYLQTPCNETHDIAQTATGTMQKGNPNNYGDKQTSIKYTTGAVPKVMEYPMLTSEHLQNAYQYARIENIYIRTENRVHLPIARYFGQNAADSTAVIVRLAGPTCRRIIRVAFERMGLTPRTWQQVDFIDKSGIQHWLLKFTPNFRAAQPTGDAVELKTVDAEYVYGLNRPPLDSEGFGLAILPWYAATSQTGSGIPGRTDISEIVTPEAAGLA